MIRRGFIKRFWILANICWMAAAAWFVWLAADITIDNIVIHKSNIEQHKAAPVVLEVPVATSGGLTLTPLSTAEYIAYEESQINKLFNLLFNQFFLFISLLIVPNAVILIIRWGLFGRQPSPA